MRLEFYGNEKGKGPKGDESKRGQNPVVPVLYRRRKPQYITCTASTACIVLKHIGPDLSSIFYTRRPTLRSGRMVLVIGVDGQVFGQSNSYLVIISWNRFCIKSGEKAPISVQRVSSRRAFAAQQLELIWDQGETQSSKFYVRLTTSDVEGDRPISIMNDGEDGSCSVLRC